MNRAWFFGDSFTAGTGVEVETEYYKEFGPGYKFSSIIAEKFNLYEINLGKPGCCNLTILSTILNNLEHIKGGDTVVIGNTSPLRDLVPSKDRSKLIDQKLFDSKPYKDSLANNNKELSEILINYCISFKDSNKELWNSFYVSMFLGLVRYFNSNGIKSLLWDYSVWSEETTPGMKFENIKQHSNGKYYDLHWSFNGHRDAANWIENGLVESIIFLNK